MTLEPEKHQGDSRKRLKFWIALLCLIAISAAYILPPLTNDRNPRPPHMHSIYDLKQIGLSLKQYALDNDNFFPPEDNSKGLELIRKLDYLTDYGCYICPGTNKKETGKGPLTENTCSYVYLGGFRADGDPKTPLAFDKPGNHNDFVTVLFLDGSAKRFSTSAAGSCENIVIFLHQKYKYPEKLFNLLIRKAKTIDSELPPQSRKQKS
jgi:hypothetical protein